ncbi:hypothetical protein [Subtercola sp. YIM 133946]|uniref:hypothetical protein n=1 Tax=Subtercola sp. YIM 133946 TaxID=3118909 RepID=UPI002F95AF93
MSSVRRMSDSSLGPQAGVMWIDSDEQRVRAKQLEMLAIDERSAEQWVNAMRELVSENLGDEEFTLKRMARLHAWEKQRKREQHNLHYKYDPRRRNPKLVERDTRRQIEAWRRRLDEKGAQLRALPALAAVEQPPHTQQPPTRRSAHRGPQHRAGRRQCGLSPAWTRSS